VLLTYSPYNVLGETRSGNLANDGYGRAFVPRGYVRAVADVLGTRNSSGCWDYGGPLEQRSGVDVVRYLARQPWSNGRVGMIGGSYDGTTATMVAAQGGRVPELKAIVPIAAISRWYGYAYQDGVRFALNSEHPTDEGLDTPFAFDFGFARTPPSDADDPRAAAKLASRVDPCDSLEHTRRGYDPSPDYDEFWLERDYRRRASSIRAAALVVHGWQDYNVKQEEATELYRALRVARAAKLKNARAERRRAPAGVPLKRLYMTQGTHGSPSGDAWDALLAQFLDRYLLGRRTGIESTPAVITEGRTVGAGGFESTGARPESSWPPAGTSERRLWLRRTSDQGVAGATVPPGSGGAGTLSPAPSRRAGDNALTWAGAPVSEELTTNDPLGERGHRSYSLFFGTAPLERPMRIAGSPVLDAIVRTPAGGHLAPVLVDVAPDGTMRTIGRGLLNVDYRDGLREAEPVDQAWVRARARILPQDTTLQPGHRLGLLVGSANTVWGIPGTTGTNTILTGPLAEVSAEGSSLRIPVAPVDGR
jgi:X-Pro dipeptidyl-peptidase